MSVLQARALSLNSCSRYQTVSTLLQYYLLMPLKEKDVHLIYLANSMAQNTMIIFTRTVHDASRYALAEMVFTRYSIMVQISHCATNPRVCGRTPPWAAQPKPEIGCFGQIQEWWPENFGRDGCR